MTLGDDEIRDGQSQAGAPARLLGREEGLEDAFEVVLGDAGAVVLDLDGSCRWPSRGRDADGRAGRSGLGHGLGRVAEQVEENLFDLGFRAGDGGQIGLEFPHDGHSLENRSSFSGRNRFGQGQGSLDDAGGHRTGPGGIRSCG